VGYPGLIGKRNVLPVWLRRAGYRTMHVGKFLNGYPPFVNPPSKVAPGWSKWYTVLRPGTHYYDYQYGINGHSRFHGHHAKDYLGRVLGKDAVRLVRHSARARRPFYLQLDERAPHAARQTDPFGSCDHDPIPDPSPSTATCTGCTRRSSVRVSSTRPCSSSSPTTASTSASTAFRAARCSRTRTGFGSRS
jgi:hypothetical protein